MLKTTKSWNQTRVSDRALDDSFFSIGEDCIEHHEQNTWGTSNVMICLSLKKDTLKAAFIIYDL